MPSALDLIWINTLERCSSGVIFVDDVSDHCPTFVHVPSTINSSDKIRITFRDHSSHNMNAFMLKLNNIDWNSSIVGDIHGKVEAFERLLNNTYCDSFPLKSKLISIKRLQKPWLTAGLLQSIKTKSLYFKLVKIGLIEETVNRAYKNKLNSLIRLAKRSCYKS